MPLQQPPTQTRFEVRPLPETLIPPSVAASIREIPYDYVAKFTLQGRPSNRVQDVINISIEGAFVAVAIGYSFIPRPLAPLPATIVPDSSVTLTSSSPLTFPATLVDIIAETLAGGFSRVTQTDRAEIRRQLTTVIRPFVEPRELMRCLLLKLCGIEFKYSIVDSGTGRELQNQPIHNLAGLGESTGARPFRPLAKPMLFMPRSTIRIEIEELSVGEIYTGAELFIVLHGYKILGYGTALP